MLVILVVDLEHGKAVLLIDPLDGLDACICKDLAIVAVLLLAKKLLLDLTDIRDFELGIVTQEAEHAKF